ncbi:MAG TPA: MFS transporter [Actinomycetota bacterium]|nr:MFS transporter [Actinomycetota bacterium]
MASREPIEDTGGFRASLSLLRRNGDFRKLYLASLISLGGDWFLLVALFGLALEFTGSAVSVAALIVAQEVPFGVASLIGGVLADRFDRRRLMVVCDVARTLLCLGFLLVNDPSMMWLAYLLLAVISSFSAVFDPASSAALPNLVEPRELGPANALSGSLWGTMLAVGAALGGIVAAALGRDAAFLIDASSFAVSGLLIARIRRPFSAERTEEPEANVIRATVETVRYARRDHRVLALVTVKAGFGIAAGVIALIAVFAHEEFGAGDAGIGALMAGRGVGALIGPFLGRWLAGPQDRRLFGAIGVALAVFGLGYATLGVMPSLFAAAVAVGIAHLGGGAQWTLSSYGLQRLVPDRIRGRIFAFDFTLITLSLTVSALVTAWAADRFGARPTVAVLGGVAVLWAAIWTWLTTDVRRATMLEGAGPAPELAAEAGPGP